MRVAIVGGTGHLGSALARRWSRAGHAITLGSRDSIRAQAVAAELQQTPGFPIDGASNVDAARAGDVVVVVVPFASQRAVLEEIREAVQGKIVIDATVPLVPPRVMRAQLPVEGSAAAIAQQTLGTAVRVVSAFHTVAAHRLATDEEIEGDVLVFGDAAEAREVAVGLARDLGLRGLHAGPLVNSAAAEALTSVLIFVNRTYRVDGAGLRITGSIAPEAAQPASSAGRAGPSGG